MKLFKTITSYSDEELMTILIDKNSHKALEEIYRRYSSRLLGYFRKMLNGDNYRSQDLLQDLFLKIWERKHQFDVNKKFSSWMFTIASNQCKHEYRKLKVVHVSHESIDESGISYIDDDLSLKNAFKADLKKQISLLEHPQRVAFVLRYSEQLSMKEIAEITNVSIGTVKSRLFYATKKITAQMQEYNPKYQTDIFKTM